MQITSLETVRTPAFPNLVWVRLHTDEGLTGLGETFYGAEAVETHLHTIVAPAILGEDPRRVEHIGALLTGYVGYTGSGVETRGRAAVDLALWDLLGQSAGEPVANLIGGYTRESLPIYNTCAGGLYVNQASGQSSSNWGLRAGLYEDLHAAIHRPGELAQELVDSGIRGMKIWPFDEAAEASRGHSISTSDLRDGLRRVGAIRDAVGDAMDIMIELHSLWDVPAARQIVAALEPFQPFWIEDPVRSDVRDGLRRVAETTPTRIAAGETVAGLGTFANLLAADAIDVVTVDLSWTGGLTEARKVAALADAHGVPIAPHDCTGPVALAACVHLASAAPNAFIQETVRAGYLGWYDGLVDGGAQVSDGLVRTSPEPGLGVRLREDLLASADTIVRTSTVAELVS